MVFGLLFPVLGVFAYLRAGSVGVVVGALLAGVGALGGILWVSRTVSRGGIRRAVQDPLLWGVTLLVVVAEVRGVLAGSQPAAGGLGRALLALTILFLLVSRRPAWDSRRPADEAAWVLGGWIGLLLLNVLGWVLDMGRIAAFYARPLDASSLSLGLLRYRPSFVLVESGQYLAYLGACTATLGLAFIRSRSYVRFALGLSGLAVGVFVVMAYGSRGAALAGLVGGTVVLLRLWRWPRLMVTGLAAIVLALPAVAAGSFSGTSPLPIDVAYVQEVLLSNRPIIWASAVALMLQSSIPAWIGGYGARGQISTGISADYAILFEGRWLDPEAAPLHNSFIQAMVDQGLLGTLVLVVLFFSVAGGGRALGRHWRRGEEEVLGGVIAIGGCLLVGAMFESMLSSYCLPALALIMWIRWFVSGRLRRVAHLGRIPPAAYPSRFEPRSSLSPRGAAPEGADA